MFRAQAYRVWVCMGFRVCGAHGSGFRGCEV